MHIELRKLKIVAALSEETVCYTAEVWIDGERAFLASNRGQGAADDFHAVGSVTEASVNAWLGANRESVRSGETILTCDLELEVAALRIPIEEAKRLRRQCRTRLITIDRGTVYGYPLRGRSVAFVAASVQRTSPDARVVNGDDAAIEDAVTLLVANTDSADALRHATIVGSG